MIRPNTPGQPVIPPHETIKLLRHWAEMTTRHPVTSYGLEASANFLTAVRLTHMVGNDVTPLLDSKHPKSLFLFSQMSPHPAPIDQRGQEPSQVMERLLELAQHIESAKATGCGFAVTELHAGDLRAICSYVESLEADLARHVREAADPYSREVNGPADLALRVRASAGELRAAMDKARTDLLRLQFQMQTKAVSGGFEDGVEAVARGLEAGDVLAPMSEDNLKSMVRSIRDVVKPEERRPGPCVGENAGIQAGAGHYPADSSPLSDLQEFVEAGRREVIARGREAEEFDSAQVDQSDKRLSLHTTHVHGGYVETFQPLPTKQPVTRPALRTTHTIVTMEVSVTAYQEIHTKLLAAGYEHAILEDGLLDLSGIGIGHCVDEGEAITGAVRE